MKPNTVAIDAIASKQSTSQLLAGKMSSLLEKVRIRAYELFERRGREHQHDLDDWFQAENELGLLSSVQLEETETGIRVRISHPELSAVQVTVYTEPQAITVEAASVQTVESSGSSQTRFSQRTLFGRYELPTTINTGKVTANLHDGVLEILARKAKPAVKHASVGGHPSGN
jgi:HSP20 family molecular chaperone IbpA